MFLNWDKDDFAYKDNLAVLVKKETIVTNSMVIKSPGFSEYEITMKSLTYW